MVTFLLVCSATVGCAAQTAPPSIRAEVNGWRVDVRHIGGGHADAIKDRLAPLQDRVFIADFGEFSVEGIKNGATRKAIVRERQALHSPVVLELPGKQVAEVEEFVNVAPLSKAKGSLDYLIAVLLMLTDELQKASTTMDDERAVIAKEIGGEISRGTLNLDALVEDWGAGTGRLRRINGDRRPGAEVGGGR